MGSLPRTRATKVFLDASVLIAAAISPRGHARDLVLQGLRGEWSLYLSSLVLEETQRNLARKAPKALPAFNGLSPAPSLQTWLIRRRLLCWKSPETVAVKDAPIVAAAVCARAHYLATYDRRHLLSQAAVIRTQFGVEVVTPGDILAGKP